MSRAGKRYLTAFYESVLILTILHHIVLNPKSIPTRALGRNVKRRLEQSYVKFFNEKLADPTSSSIKMHVGKQLSEENKLRTYKLIKTKYAIEPYLLCVTNRGKRQSMSKLRRNNHSLVIETGRHKKLEVDNRLCLKCNVIEDEIHFFTKCRVFDTTRQRFLKDQ